MRVVLDTNILVRAAVNADGAAASLLRQITAGPHTLITSPYILGELVRVLAYPRLRARWGLGQARIHEYAERVAAVAEIVRPAIVHQVVSSDPDDDSIVQTAVTGRADVLCTRDTHLLKLGVVSYCAERGVRVMDDVALRRLLAGL
jgi:putative PIN family toxin of toxin-antitoxin system